MAGFLILACCASLAHAQAVVPPDAGSLQRQIEAASQPPAVPATAPQIATPMPEAQKGAQVSVQGFSITGNSLIASDELLALLQDRIGQTLTLAELEHAAQRIAEHYRQRGWFVRAYLPAQDITDGHIRIHIVEGRFDGVRLQTPVSTLRANADFVQRIVGNDLISGEPLAAARLERGLLLANDLPGIRATGILEAGEQPGTTALALSVADTPFVTGDLGLNNHGIKATGRAQLSGGLALNNLGGNGDRLSLRGLLARDIASAALNYSLPLGSNGWRLGLNASHLDYKLGKQYKPLNADGKANSYGATLSWAVLRSSRKNLTLSGRIERRDYQDDMLNAPLRRQRIDAFSLGLEGDLIDRFGGGAYNSGSLQLTHGRLDLRGLAGDIALDQAGPRAQGGYSKLTLRLARNQTLDQHWSLQINLAGQYADRNLASSEKFSLGGPYGIRAYPVNEAMGDHGLLATLELRRLIAQGLTASAFIDSGRIQLHHRTWPGWQGGGSTPNHYSLTGAGFGLTWSAPGNWYLSAAIAKPLGSNPGRDLNDANNDGSHHRSTRGWLTLHKFF
ncbi:hypothetical protein ACY05_00460 [Sterolibacterium denitrificans]|uniref:POTRA domain-containing protein n=1 Tax=Sterolibacterium denitrificans TaxID=157592 RepID=A0A656Z9A7_9PROT|nr:hypothetical protein ACY05_00460 [Sterolibacterium denitrificans]